MEVTVTGTLEQLAGPPPADPTVVLHWLVGDETLYNAIEAASVDFEVCPVHQPDEEPDLCDQPGAQWRFTFQGAKWA